MQFRWATTTEYFNDKDYSVEDLDAGFPPYLIGRHQQVPSGSASAYRKKGRSQVDIEPAKYLTPRESLEQSYREGHISELTYKRLLANLEVSGA